MSKIAVIYKTKYGSTKRYAEWIAEKLGADIFEISKFNFSEIDKYNAVFFGSSVNAGRIKKINFIKDNWNKLKNKTVVIFSVSASPSDDPDQQKLFAANLPEEIRKNIAFYPLQGAYDYNKLDKFDKFIMSFPKMILTLRCWVKKDKKSKEDLEQFYTPQDFTNESAVEPIVEYVKSRNI